jgi:hypothetical protein
MLEAIYLQFVHGLIFGILKFKATDFFLYLETAPVMQDTFVTILALVGDDDLNK